MHLAVLCLPHGVSYDEGYAYIFCFVPKINSYLIDWFMHMFDHFTDNNIPIIIILLLLSCNTGVIARQFCKFAYGDYNALHSLQL